MILIYTALLAIPDELIDAATVDGLNQFQAFIWVKLPLIWPTIGLGVDPHLRQQLQRI